MTTLLVIARAIHYASAMLLLGQLVFALGVARPVFRRARSADGGDDFERRYFAFACWGLAVSVASGAVWFSAMAAVMSGLTGEQAMTRETLGLILGTVFGLVFAARAGLAIALAAVLIAVQRSNDRGRRSSFAIAGGVLAAVYVGSLAGVGHAAAGDESDYLVRIVADVAHLLAAGAWLGALPALVLALVRTQAADAARRFSTLGVASVGILTASGFVSAWYQVGDIPGLIGTDYGRLLLAKLALFAAMLVLATVNRGIATRPFSGEDHQALRLLRRNATLEIGFGIAVIAIVGVLGVAVPAAHQPAIWPFDRTLSFEPIQQSPWMQFVVTAAIGIACVAAVALVAGTLGRPPNIRIAAVVGTIVPGGILAFLLAVPAHPTTYVVSPVRYTAEAIATGSALYARHCSDCHGRGEGSGGPSLVDIGWNLSDRVSERREGDLFWSIAHGIPGTPMPGYASQMSDVEIWSLNQLLDAQTAAQNALAMSDRIKPLRPIPAPDFTYEFAGRPQESLRDQRDSRVTLLVFYTLPSSLPRLAELATLARPVAAAGARVIALPMPESSAATPHDLRGDGESMLALASPTVATTYLMFARETHSANVGAPAHVEYLIDRFGYLRVRRVGEREAAVSRSAETLRLIDVLIHEPPRPPVEWGHRH